MRLDALLRAHGFLRVERPPELWEADTPDTALIPLLGEMIVAVMQAPDVAAVTLNASNVEIPHDEGPAPRGRYVALTLSGPRRDHADAAWLRGAPPAPGRLGELHERLVAAGVRYAYIRRLEGGTSFTVFLASP